MVRQYYSRQARQGMTRLGVTLCMARRTVVRRQGVELEPVLCYDGGDPSSGHPVKEDTMVEGEGKSKVDRLVSKAVVKVVEELRELAHKKASAESAQIALDGMLEGFIEQARQFKDLDDQVVEQLQELAEVFPDSPLPWLNLSQVYLERDEFEQAKKAAEQGLKVEPGEVGLVFNRALALEEMGDYEAAIVGFKHCIEVNPHYPCLLYTSPSPRDRTRSRMPSSA